MEQHTMEKAAAALLEHVRSLNGENADLTREIPTTDFPEPYRSTAQELNRFVSRVRSALIVLDDALQKVSNKEALHVVQLKNLSAAVDGQTTNIRRVSRGLEELNGGVNQVAQAAQVTAEVTGQMERMTSKGIADVGDVLAGVEVLGTNAQATLEAVQAMAARSRRVSDAIRVIEDVAQTSRLLAINAAIEAAHAGDKGRGFAVVANEVQRLASRTTTSAHEVKGLIQEIELAVSNSVQAMTEMAAAAEESGQRARDTAGGLEQVKELVERSAREVVNIAAVAEEQAAGTSTLTEAAHNVNQSVEVAAAALDLTRGVEVSDTSEQAQSALGQFVIGSRFDTLRGLVMSMAAEIEASVEGLVASNQVRLEDLWDTGYEELRGPLIQGLARLFDVSRVPSTGFVPPKFRTKYDQKVDKPIIDILDRYIGRERGLIYVSTVDLNGFMFGGCRKLAQDWTGDPQRDLLNNRLKRLVSDPPYVRGARVGLPAGLQKLPRVTRRDLEAVGMAKVNGTRPFLLQTWARDTGDVVKDLTVPVYIRGQRWVTARLGYTP